MEIQLDKAIPYNPHKASAGRGPPAEWRKPPGERVLGHQILQLGSSQDNAIELSDTPLSDNDSTMSDSVDRVDSTLVFGSSKAATASEDSASSSIIESASEIDRAIVFSREILKRAGTGNGSADDTGFLPIDDIFCNSGPSTLQKRRSSLPFSNSLPYHSPNNDVSCISIRSRNASSIEACDTSQTDAADYDISQSKRINGITTQQVSNNPHEIIPQSQQEPAPEPAPALGQLEHSLSSLFKSTGTEEHDRMLDYRIQSGHAADETDEGPLNSRAKRARRSSASRSLVNRRQRNLNASSSEDEAEHISNASYKPLRKRTRVVRQSSASRQSATIQEGVWQIVKIVGERRGIKGKQLKVRWKDTWVPVEYINADDCRQRWEEQKCRRRI